MFQATNQPLVTRFRNDHPRCKTPCGMTGTGHCDLAVTKQGPDGSGLALWQSCTKACTATVELWPEAEETRIQNKIQIARFPDANHGAGNLYTYIKNGTVL